MIQVTCEEAGIRLDFLNKWKTMIQAAAEATI